ncbi:MAG: response regulator [Spirochaetota bacterium]
MSDLRPRVLIVEDEALIALLLERQLRSLGCDDIAKTPSGEGAVEKTGAAPFDLVLMDIHLSGKLNGIEATRMIMARATHPVIAFMTAFGDPASRKAALELDPLAFLEKPLGVENLKVLLLSPGMPGREPA